MDDNFVLQIKNYQLIRKAKLEFIPGLNVIVGETNNGKSSILRAVQTALFNISKASRVTRGETKSAVGIRYRGHEIIWRRDNQASSPMSYRVDGKILAKLGKGQPEIIAQLTGIREVELDTEKIRLNYSKQMSYPFLLDKTPSQLFKFIVQSAEEDNVMDVIQGMKTDLNQMYVNRKAYEESRESLRVAYSREVKRYQVKKEVMPYTKRVLELEPKVKQYSDLGSLIDEIEGREKEVESNSRILEGVRVKIDRIENVVGKVEKKIEEAFSLEAVIQELDWMLDVEKAREEKLEQLEAEERRYKDLDSQRERLSRIDEKINQRTQIGNLVKLYEDSENEIELTLKEIKDLEERDSLIGETLKELELHQESLRSLREQAQELDSFICELEELEEILAESERQKEETRALLSRIEEDISGFNVCPYCGSELGGK